MHSKGSYKPEDLESTSEYQNVIRETNNILSRSLKDNDLSEGMLKSLQNDVFLFSGLKTHAQLFEASRQLLTEDKTIKSFTQFSNDVSKIKGNYNKNYLEAEYDFAVGSVQMADKWDNFSDSERYLLQYRTAGDDKVRITHQPLHNITLPKSDKFWNKFFPPNGWRCRCATVQVLAHTNKQSDSEKAYKKGNKATTQLNKSGKNKLEIFRFNAGRQKVVFPPKHTYRKVKGANKVEPIILTIINADENKILLKETYKKVRENYTGIVKSKQFGSVSVSKTSFRKTQNINTGNYENQIEALNEIKNLKKHLDDFKGKISLKNINDEIKGNKKKNILGYFKFKTKNKKYLIELEKDNAIKENFKLYYIKKVINP